MKQPNNLSLIKVTIATLNRPELQYKPGVKATIFSFAANIYKDTNIPTSYTTPICAGARGILVLQ